MSIGKRLIDLAKSELNSLLDRAAKIDEEEERPSGDEMGEPPPRSARPARPRTSSARPGRAVRLEDLSDEELEAEIERRRLDRELDERARRNANARTASGAYRAATGSYGGSAGPGNTGRPSGGRSTGGARPWSPPGDPVAKAYAALEVPPGSSFEVVRKAYRNLMRKYHPDRHTASPEKQRAANELAQKLTASYEVLEKHLKR